MLSQGSHRPTSHRTPIRALCVQCPRSDAPTRPRPTRGHLAWAAGATTHRRQNKMARSQMSAAHAPAPDARTFGLGCGGDNPPAPEQDGTQPDVRGPRARARRADIWPRLRGRQPTDAGTRWHTARCPRLQGTAHGAKRQHPPRQARCPRLQGLVRVARHPPVRAAVCVPHSPPGPSQMSASGHRVRPPRLTTAFDHASDHRVRPPRLTTAFDHRV